MNFREAFTKRRTGLLSMALFTTYICCGFSDPQGCDNKSSNGPIIAAGAILGGVVVGTVILVHVHNTHHNVKGCVFTGPNGGLEVQTTGDDPRNFALSGDVPSLKVGDVVKLHGNKLKHNKGDKADQEFVVQKMNKDYGPCKVPVKSAADLQQAKTAHT